MATKDPLKLSVKEKALLAQKALMGTPEKQKPGPPVPRKPKPGSAAATPVLTSPPMEDTGETTPSSSMSPEEKRMKRAQSLDDDIGGESPQQSRRKLPPGAFNMMRMGGIPILGGPAGERSRCATVSTSDFSDRDRNSLERHISPEDLQNGNSHDETGSHEHTDGSANEKSPPTRPRPVPPVKSRSVDELEPPRSTESPSATPPTPAKFQHGDSAESAPPASTPEETGGDSRVEVDCDVVLTWTPDVTAAWLSKIGLGAHQQVFLEKGIQGYMLFDIDGH